MATIVYSVPHTGTRFTIKFFDQIGVAYRQFHTDSVEQVEEDPNPKIVVPMRDPLLCWMSHYIPHVRALDINRSERIQTVVDNLVEDWALLGYIEDRFNYVHLRLDTKDKQKELQKVADYVKAQLPISKFKWENIGVSKDVPGNYELWETLKQTLNQDEIACIMSSLSAIRKKYGYL